MKNKLDKLLTASKEMLEDILGREIDHDVPVIHEWEQIIKEAGEELDNMLYYAKRELA